MNSHEPGNNSLNLRQMRLERQVGRVLTSEILVIWAMESVCGLESA